MLIGRIQIFPFLFLLANLVWSIQARLSWEEKQAITDAAEAADKEIRFIKLDQIESTIQSSKAAILMFGAAWCINTKKMTPKWLDVQKRVDAAGYKNRGFQMAKIECTEDGEKMCADKYGIEGYPTMLVYLNGQRKEEYPGADEADPLVNYIRDLTLPFTADSEIEQGIVKGVGNQKAAINVGSSTSQTSDPVSAPANSKVVAEEMNQVPSTASSGWSSSFLLVIGGCIGCVLIAINPTSRRLVSRAIGLNGQRNAYRRLHTPP